MTPDFKILADSTDVTAQIRDRFMSLVVTDQAGMDSDTVKITLDDRAPHIELPRTGAELTVSLGYASTGLARMGLYVVDEIEISGPPNTLTVSAKAANMRQAFKATKSRSWDQITIGDLVTTIAAEHGYTAKVSESFSATLLEHLDQSEESDLHLLTRLARERGAVAKPANGLLLFVPTGELKSASGVELTPVAVKQSDLTRWHATMAERGKYGSVQTRWHDNDTAQDVIVTAGSDDPVYVIRHAYPDAATATAAAAAKLAAFERGAATISATLPGNNVLMAEGILQITTGRTGLTGSWLLKTVTHTIDRQGYRCDIDGESP